MAEETARAFEDVVFARDCWADEDDVKADYLDAQFSGDGKYVSVTLPGGTMLELRVTYGMRGHVTIRGVH